MSGGTMSSNRCHVPNLWIGPENPVLNATSAVSSIGSLKNAQMIVTVHDDQINALAHTGSSDSYINFSIAKANDWKLTHHKTA